MNPTIKFVVAENDPASVVVRAIVAESKYSSASVAADALIAIEDMMIMAMMIEMIFFFMLFPSNKLLDNFYYLAFFNFTMKPI